MFNWLFGRKRRRRRKSAELKAAEAALRRRGQRVLRLKTGLTYKAAYRAASRRLRSTGFDFRGFTYNARTGRAVCT